MQDNHTTWFDLANAPKGAAHEQLFSWVDYVSQQTRTQRMDVRICLEAVSNFNPTGNGEVTAALRSQLPYRIRDNILRAGVDTVASLVSQARTAPQYLTTASQWDVSRIAEKKSRVLQGQMYDLKVFELIPRSFIDACEGAGTGYVQGRVNEKGMTELERCLPNETYVDPEDGRYGEPSKIGRKRFVERRKVMARWGKTDRLKGLIAVAGGPTAQDYVDFFLRRDSKADLVALVEGYALPSCEGAGDGRHVIALSNCTLLDEKWNRSWLPFVAVQYAERTQGTQGQSLVERMLPAQMRVSEIDEVQAQSQRLGSTAKWMVEENSNVDTDALTNALCDVVTYQAAMPNLVAFSGTLPDLAEQRREIKSDVFDQEGLSSNAQTGDVNKGLQSARAIRAAVDTTAQRFITPARLLERAYLDTVRLIENLNDLCAENDNNYAPKGRYRSGRRRWLKSTRWVDLKIPEGEGDVQLFPISAQATTPQARWSSVEEWIQAGFVSKPQAMDLLEFPDLESFETLENANLDLIHEQIDNLIDLEEGKPQFFLPIPNQDLAMAAKIVNDAYLVAFRLNAPPEVQQRFENYLAYCKVKQDEMAAAANPAPLAPAALDPNAAAAAQLGAVDPMAATIPPPVVAA